MIAVDRIAVDSLPQRISSQIRSIESVADFHARFGGVATSLESLVSSLSEEGTCIPSVAAFGRDVQTIPATADVFTFPLSRISWAFTNRHHRKWRDLASRSDLIHAHGIWQAHCGLSACASNRSRKPLIISAHGMLDKWSLSQKWIKKRLYSALCERRNLRQASCLRALTQTEADDYRRFGLKAPIAVIPNGVNIPRNLSPQLFLSKFPNLVGKRIVLFLSRIHPKKGLSLLCRAWSRLSLDSPDAHLVIAGPGFSNEATTIKGLVQSLGASNSVTFTGMLQTPEKWSALSAAQVFVLPSYSEGFSMAVLEAMAAGLPVIATRQCNFPMIETSGCGWLISPDERSVEQALREALEAIPAELRDKGNHGRDLVRSRFSWVSVAASIAALYASVVGGSPPSAFEFQP